MTENDFINIMLLWCGVMVCMGVLYYVSKIIDKIINHRKKKERRLKKIDGTKGYRIVTR